MTPFSFSDVLSDPSRPADPWFRSAGIPWIPGSISIIGIVVKRKFLFDGPLLHLLFHYSFVISFVDF